MKLAICGKGGVGKTTISGALCRLLGKEGYKILAVDGDPNPNLSFVLGLDSESSLPPALSSDILERVEENGNRRVQLSIPLEEVLQKYGRQASDNVTLITVGQPDHAGTGCMCGSYTTVREVVHAALAEGNAMTILDMEASLEHMKRGTSKYVDAMYAVVEPYYRSLEAAGRYKRLADELDVKIYAIANKVRNKEEEEAIRQYCEKADLPLEAIIPYDSKIAEADLAGKSIMDYTNTSEAIEILQQLAAKISSN